MKNYTIIFLFILFLLNSCQEIADKKEFNTPTIQASREDYKIINATLVHLLLNRTINDSTEFEYQNFILKDEKIKNKIKLYFTNELVAITDTTVFQFPLIKNRQFKSTLKKMNQTLNSIYSKHFKISADSITNGGIWNLKLIDKSQKISGDYGTIKVTYSRIIYNDNQTKAVFYFQNNCVGLCGYGNIVDVEKINGIWRITNIYNDWIS
jgi:hypothetical protein